MKTFTITALLTLPLTALAAAAPAPADPTTVNSLIGVAPFFSTHDHPIEGGVKKRDDICPYEKCLDDCISWTMMGPCNPMDLCDPGLGCALGCAVACR
ncbi:hypothetical protein QBC34DRAFT_387143 [Podospora aff. communis PSN243]|uniref:Uncharacterized protein n=1 Tax=Podospora aff. communis PSN243 TaxID=3040156 RepID=A0AAV9G690_9PEZI|nr:hypothetical protein QBC34DRAFT_387143 [Podospora aff. communis PSN243]